VGFPLRLFRPSSFFPLVLFFVVSSCLVFEALSYRSGFSAWASSCWLRFLRREFLSQSSVLFLFFGLFSFSLVSFSISPSLPTGVSRDANGAPVFLFFLTPLHPHSDFADFIQPLLSIGRLPLSLSPTCS